MDINPFLLHAQAQVNAEYISEHLSPELRESIIRWKSYLKRIKVPPEAVLKAATHPFEIAAKACNIEFESLQAVALTMDKLGDILWNALDAQTQREWLLKAI